MTRVEFANSISIIKVYKDFLNIEELKKDNKGNVLCPLHDDHNPSFHFYTDKNRFFCFGCRRGGGPIDFILHLKYGGDQRHFVDAVNLLCKKYGYVGDDYKSEEIKFQDAYDRRVRYSNELEIASKAFHRELTKVSLCDNYFTKRGISEEIQKAFCLGYFAPNINFKTDRDISNYVKAGFSNHDGYGLLKGFWVSPIRDRNGYVVGHISRDPKGGDAKYKNSPDSNYFHKSELLFNFDKAKNSSDIIVVEGLMDCLSLVQAGYSNTVALLGCSMSDAQFELLKGHNIILALDNDEAGRQAMFKIIKEHPQTMFKVINNTEAKDFNDILCSYGSDKVNKIAEKRINNIDYLFRYYERKSFISEEDATNFWMILASILGADESDFRDMYPLNKEYSPITFRMYWNKFNEVMKHNGF